MTVLKAGQKLWWVDWKQQTEGYVIVADITEEKILVWYHGKIRERPHSVIGKKLFLTPQLDQKTKTKSTRVSHTSVKLEYVPVYRKKYSTANRKSSVMKEEIVENRFFEPIRKTEKSCDRCALRKNGTCGSLQNQLCEDYRSLQIVCAEERNAYPQSGDATAVRKKDRKHFK